MATSNEENLERMKVGPVVFSVFLLAPPILLAQIDVTPPSLVSLSLTPSTVDTSSSSQAVIVRLGLTDNLSGVLFTVFQNGYNAFSIRSPSGKQTINLRGNNIGVFTLENGNKNSGVWMATLTLPAFSEPGVWTITSIVVPDADTNTLNLNTSGIQALGLPTTLNVVSIADVTPPALVSFGFSPPSIDVSGGNQQVSLNLGLSDSQSGVFFPTSLVAFILQVISPSGKQSQWLSSRNFTLTLGSAQNGTWQGTLVFPRYSEPGTWTIQSLTLQDAANNVVSFNAAAIQALGFSPSLSVGSVPADISGPVVTSVSLSPTLIDTTVSAKPVTVTLNVTDDLSGVSFANTTNFITFYWGVIFKSPSGAQTQRTPFGGMKLLAGGPLKGTWQGTVTFPQFSEGGTWNISSVTLKDTVTNTTALTTANLQSAGFPTGVQVIQPSGIVDGTIPSSGGTVMDQVFGARAEVVIPPGALTQSTDVSIDVFQSPLSVPIPRGFSAFGSRFVNIDLNPHPAGLLPSPGLSIVIPLVNPGVPGSALTLYRIDPLNGNLVPAVSVAGGFVTGAVSADGLNAAFSGIASLSTVVGLVPAGGVPGDLSGDGVVDCADLAIVKASFGKRTGQPGFDPRADVNNNGVVDISDLAFVSRQLPSGLACASSAQDEQTGVVQ